MSFYEELKRRNVVRAAVLYCVSSWLVLQVAALLFEALELPPSTLRLVLIVLVLGFPLFLAFSWVYQLTPGGLKREARDDPDESATRTTGRTIDVLIVLLLVVIIAVMAAGYLLPDHPGTAGSSATDRSIAVLPFANRSAREEDVFFVDGIHDDILTQLARIGSLTVISRTSVERFRNTMRSTREIGALLGVRHILEGGVQRAGDSVRINVQLIDVATDAHLWAQTYDRELTTANIFAIQNEISFAIANALQAALSPEERQQLETTPTDNLPALEAYFLGRQAAAKRTTASLAEAARHFERAIELDPGYALAYVGLAETHAMQIMYSDAPTEQQRNLARPLIDRALAIDDRLGEAYLVKAVLRTDPAEREALYKQGLELAPGYATGHQWYGEFLIYYGRAEEALVQLREAARLDPLSSIIRAKLGDTLQSLGRFDEARESYEASLKLDPNFAFTHYSLGDLAWFVDGRLDEAVRHIGEAARLDPGNPLYPAYLAALWSDLGDDAEAQRWIQVASAVPGSGYFVNSTAIYIKWNHGDRAGALADAEAILAEVPTDAFALWTLALDDLDRGTGDAAVARYLDAYPAFRDEAEVAIDPSNYYAAIDFGYVLLATGETARGRHLLERCLEHLATRPRLSSRGYWMNDVRIHAMLGDDEQALSALTEAVDAGWRVYWRIYLPHDPALAALRERPKFPAIVARLEADMAAQRERLTNSGLAGNLHEGGKTR